MPLEELFNLDDIRANLHKELNRIGLEHLRASGIGRRAGEKHQLYREIFQAVVFLTGIQEYKKRKFLITIPNLKEVPDYRLIDPDSRERFSVENMQISPVQIETGEASNEESIANFIYKKKPPSLLGKEVMLAVYGNFPKEELDLGKLSMYTSALYRIPNDIWFYTLVDPSHGLWVIHRLNPPPPTNRIYTLF